MSLKGILFLNINLFFININYVSGISWLTNIYYLCNLSHRQSLSKKVINLCLNLFNYLLYQKAAPGGAVEVSF